VRPKVCVITSISLDHTDVLGNTLAEIAREKTGIIKPGGVVISSPQSDEAMDVIEHACYISNAPLIKVGEDITWQSLKYDTEGQSLTVNGRKGSYNLSIPLLGQYQAENAVVAVTALECLIDRDFSISVKNISDGLAKVNWPGRLQVLNRNPLVIVDGAHNPNSLKKMVEALRDYFNFKQGILIFGASSDKDITGMVQELVQLFKKVIITRSIHPRAKDVDGIVNEFNKYGVETPVTDDISEALPLALDIAGEDDIICVTGSLFVVAGAIEQADELGLKG
jgi:dihydrofolate synthase/folylpolyglutamate synthase